MNAVQLSTLRDTLAGLYFDKQSISRVVTEADLSRISLDGRLVDIWQSVIDVASEANKIDDLIAIALKDYPDNNALKTVLLDSPILPAAPSFVDQNEEREIKWKGSNDVSKLEKIIGDRSTLLPISFLEEGLQKSTSVARVRLKDGGYGTGFLTENNLLVTNNHVLPDKETARSARVEFNFQKSIGGLDLEACEYRCQTKNGFLTSIDDDWTVVRLAGNPNDNWNAIPIQPKSCSLSDRVLIIQHPSGGPKAIGLYHNLVTSATESRLQYLTDTMPGSSGAPVFDNDWDLVAVHHSGGWLREPGSKTKLFRNEGIVVNVVLKGAKDLLGE